MTVRLTEEARNLTRSTLFGKDFETYVNEIIDAMRLIFGDEITANWTQPSSPGLTLIEKFAFGLSTLSWYGDRQADDTNLRDVRVRTAAVTIARLLGYKPAAAVAPAIEITMTLDFAPTTTRLTLERGRKLVGPGGLFYELTEEVIFDVGEVGPKTFSAAEGETLEEIFTSDGQPGQFFLVETIPVDKSIAQDSPRVFVNGVEWEEKALLTFERTDQFEVGYGFNPVRLQFGDGIAGNIPPVDAEIRMIYRATSGTAGVVQANTVTAFQEPLVAGTQTLSATLVHNDPSTPGSPRETINSIKVNAPQVFQTADRAVTQADYDALINAFVDPIWGQVGIGRATVPRSVSQDAEALTIIAEMEAGGCPADTVTRLRTYWDKVLASSCQANVVIAQILALDTVGRYVAAPSGLARSLETYLDARAESTVKVKVTDGSINLLAVDVSVGVRVAPSITTSEAQDAVLANVRSVVEDALLGRDYGESLRIGDLYALAEAVSGVQFTNIAITAINGGDPSSRLNSFGDLEIEDFEVITLGNQVTPTLI